MHTPGICPLISISGYRPAEQDATCVKGGSYAFTGHYLAVESSLLRQGSVETNSELRLSALPCTRPFFGSKPLGSKRGRDKR